MIYVRSLRLFTVTGLIFLLTIGCGIFQPKYEHYNSCGPDAIFYAFRWHGIESSRVKISREILEDNKACSLLRDVLSIFDSRLNEITFPQEIEDELSKYDIKVRSISLEQFKELKKDEKTTAIILIHPEGKLVRYHWLFYPTQSDSPSDYFGLGTTVDKIYILERVTN